LELEERPDVERRLGFDEHASARDVGRVLLGELVDGCAFVSDFERDRRAEIPAGVGHGQALLGRGPMLTGSTRITQGCGPFEPGTTRRATIVFTPIFWIPRPHPEGLAFRSSPDRAR